MTNDQAIASLSIRDWLRAQADAAERAEIDNCSYNWTGDHVKGARNTSDLLEWYEKRCAWYQQQLDVHKKEIAAAHADIRETEKRLQMPFDPEFIKQAARRVSEAIEDAAIREIEHDPVDDESGSPD